MGANIELDIFLKKGRFSLKYIFTLLEAKGFQVNIKEIQIFDDWYYTNEINIDPVAIERDLDGIYLEKFTRIYFIVNTIWRCTLLTSIEDGCFNLSFGLDTDNLFQNGDHGFEDSIRAFLNSITTSIIDAFEDPPLKELFLVKGSLFLQSFVSITQALFAEKSLSDAHKTLQKHS